MRTSDPDAYDQFVELTVGSTTYSVPFRGIIVSTSAAASITFTIGQVYAGAASTTEKTMVLHFGVGTTVIPMAGETIKTGTASASGTRIYAVL